MIAIPNRDAISSDSNVVTSQPTYRGTLAHADESQSISSASYSLQELNDNMEPDQLSIDISMNINVTELFFETV